LSEEELIRRILSGEKELFRVLVERYYDMAYARAAALVLDREDAEEIAQESFITAYAFLGTLRDPSRFAAWLGGIVKRKAVYFLRKKVKKQEFFEGLKHEAATYTMEGGPADPEARGLEEERRRIIAEELAALEPKYREVLYMRYFKDASYKEIADFLGLTPSGVDSRLERARARLLKRLKKRGISE